jgi:hypothetical protein
MQKHESRWMRFFLVVIVVGCSSDAPLDWRVLLSGSGNLDQKLLPRSSSFALTDNLMCKVHQASDPAEVGQSVALLNLNGQDPRVLFASGVSSPVQIVFNSKETVTLLPVASGTGSVDAIVLDKASGTFARAVAGSSLELYAGAQLGTCS